MAASHRPTMEECLVAAYEEYARVWFEEHPSLDHDPECGFCTPHIS